MFAKYVRPGLLILTSAFLLYLNLRPINRIDPELEVYHNMFNKALETTCGDRIRKPRQIIVKFEKIKELDIMGLCERNFFRSVIKIDKEKWDTLSASEKLALMMHEETHCQLKVEHNNNPRHYMYPDIIQTNPMIVLTQVLDQMKESCK
jgi:hypothetical protein